MFSLNGNIGNIGNIENTEKGENMKITGVKSLCCGAAVKLHPVYRQANGSRELKKSLGDAFYICLKCKKGCEAYYTALVERRVINRKRATP